MEDNNEQEQVIEKKAKRGTKAAAEVEAPELEGFELLYLGNKPEKVVEMPDGCTFTFKKESPKQQYAKGVITCEECYIAIMNNAGPGAPEQSITFMPPAQIKPYLAMKASRDKAREEALAILKQPWKAEQAKRAQKE